MSFEIHNDIEHTAYLNVVQLAVYQTDTATAILENELTAFNKEGI